MKLFLVIYFALSQITENMLFLCHQDKGALLCIPYAACVYLYNTSLFGLASFQLLKNHVSLVTTILNSPHLHHLEALIYFFLLTRWKTSY
jgi:hypothetical protein